MINNEVNIMEKIKKYNWLKIALIIIAILFVIPSIVYLIKNKTTFNFNGNLEFCFLLSENINRSIQTGLYFLLICTYILIYSLILKKRKELFKTEKSVYKFILYISIIFMFVMPFWCSDIFYYLGIGRLGSFYHQNPYYTDIKSYFDNSNIDLLKDTLMQKGYNNYWSATTVVYGPIWTFICSVVALLSFGNLDFGLLLFKLINLLIHIGNCYLLYKLSKKKLFPLMYGLNPFVLIEGLANVHNDIFVVFFMLLSIYFLLKKKNLLLSLLSLAFATDIKYFSILLLPLLVLYSYRDENIKTRIVKCIKYGIIYIVFVTIPYLIFIRDANVFLGLVTQRERLAKGLYLTISMIIPNSGQLVTDLKNMDLIVFSICYIINCFVLLINKKIKFYKEIRSIYWFVVAFLFLLLTNFQPWYFMWLSVFVIWQKKNNIKLINQMQILTLIANIVFLIGTESYTLGPAFFAIYIMGIVFCVFKNTNVKKILKL